MTVDLRAYADILMRRWWVVAGLTLLTAAIAILTSPFTQGGYTATVRLLLSVPSEAPRGAYFTYDKYYSLLSTEYVTDDYIEVVRSKGFLQDVRRETSLQGSDLTITAQPRSERAPRVLTVAVGARDENDAQRAANAAVDLIVSHSEDYFPGLGNRGVIARLIDPAEVASATAGGRALLNVGLRTLLGLAVGLALAFLLHYVDPRLYTAAEVRRHVGLPVLGEVPKYGEPS